MLNGIKLELKNCQIKKYTTVLIVFIAIIGCSQDVEPIPTGLIEFDYTSQETNSTYVLRVNLPQTYSSTTSNYPILYQLDGNTTTGSVVRDYLSLVENGVINEFIIVSIDYKNDNQRVRDFTPTVHSNFDNSGGAEDFLKFLSDELNPLLNQKYRVDSVFGNTLRGKYLGGLFGSYVLFKQESRKPLFTHFIIESPSWWWDDNYILELENEYANNNSDFSVEAYFSVGEYEAASMKGAFEVMKKRLVNRSFLNFEYAFETLRKLNHLEVRENRNGLIKIFGK